MGLSNQVKSVVNITLESKKLVFYSKASTEFIAIVELQNTSMRLINRLLLKNLNRFESKIDPFFT